MTEARIYLYLIVMKKITIEKLAEITQDEFSRMEKKMATKEMVGMLDEKVDNGFSALRQEMREGFRAVLAAVETVEYTKLRMRIDAIEERLEYAKIGVARK